MRTANRDDTHPEAPHGRRLPPLLSSVSPRYLLGISSARSWTRGLLLLLQVSRVEFKTAVRDKLRLPATVTQIDELFDKLDVDGRGAIALETLEPAVRSLHALCRKEATWRAGARRRVEKLRLQAGVCALPLSAAS